MAVSVTVTVLDAPPPPELYGATYFAVREAHSGSESRFWDLWTAVRFCTRRGVDRVHLLAVCESPVGPDLCCEWHPYKPGPDGLSGTWSGWGEL